MNRNHISKRFKIKVFLLLTLALTFATYLKAQDQSIRVYGNAPEYSNFEIVFEHYQNFINHEQQPLFTIKIDENGDFDTRRSLDQITYAFADLGKFRGFLYLQPGKEYELKLPPRGQLSQAQRLNPFFQPEEILLGIRNETSQGLNPLIRDFDDAFNDQLNKHAVKLITRKNRSLANAIIDSLETEFPSRGEFFSHHKQYRYARLQVLSSRGSLAPIIDRHYADQPVFFQMPAYWETFKDVFKGFGRKLFERLEGTGPLNFEKLVATIREDTLYQRTSFSETLALWSIYKSYHEKIIPKKFTIHLLNEAAQQAQTPEIRSTAAIIHKRMTALQTGTKAPAFDLISFRDGRQSLEDFRGKFVYLNFVHTDDHACRKDMNRMPRLLEKYGKDLSIVTVIVNEDYDRASQYVKNHQQEGWHFLYFGMNANLMKNYNVEAVPLYYLINPEGNLVASPAPSPGENFQDTFISVFKAYQRQLQRQNRSGQQSMFKK